MFVVLLQIHVGSWPIYRMIWCRFTWFSITFHNKYYLSFSFFSLGCTKTLRFGVVYNVRHRSNNVRLIVCLVSFTTTCQVSKASIPLYVPSLFSHRQVDDLDSRHYSTSSSWCPSSLVFIDWQLPWRQLLLSDAVTPRKDWLEALQQFQIFTYIGDSNAFRTHL